VSRRALAATALVALLLSSGLAGAVSAGGQAHSSVAPSVEAGASAASADVTENQTAANGTDDGHLRWVDADGSELDVNGTVTAENDAADDVDSAADVYERTNATPHVGHALAGTYVIEVYSNDSLTTKTVEDRTLRFAENATLSRTGREVVETADDGEPRSPVLFVSNRTKHWYYEPSSQRAIYSNQTRPVADYSHAFRGTDVATASHGAENGSEGAENDSGPAPHPGPSLGEVNATYRGVDTVANRTAHVVTFERDEPMDRARTVWFDAEYFVPLREVVISNQSDGDTLRFEKGYVDVAFDPNVSADAFDFAPPENATVAERSRPEQYASFERLQNETAFDVAEPTLPENATFRNAMLLENEGLNRTTLHYSYRAAASNETADRPSVDPANRTVVSFMIANRDGLEVESGENVSVNGHTGQLREDHGNAYLSWRDGNYTYRATLLGNFSEAFDREDLIAAAESVDGATFESVADESTDSDERASDG
jgi:outer membrane lipoprotein-sorting protein